ncbi:hypothetical protein A2773_03855 [Candidatus Gottesmanbacteria bacterium RIFCSPHIGHO2_01_FULL_39_10]|uniref:DUF5652 domain-containing protein n=1 Tax=Candidatus Gottesmanbacteria bacterium RIFCSPHIGHO2_01_FULL_39_10 TaxID=1798375 RepID=A0A1F5ZNA5_9BACT|nr:MAG: hypothetical protein A2773_03855 [Candidatus Gottesmanbacteria bacterium RIFCSPHIGHO2_01_FULL_39_10]
MNNLWWVIPLVVWDISWKGVALWKAAQKKNKWWFIALLLINSAGLIPMVYIFIIDNRIKTKV